MKHVSKIYVNGQFIMMSGIPRLVGGIVPSNHSFDPAKTKDVVLGKNRAWPVPKKRGR